MSSTVKRWVRVGLMASLAGITGAAWGLDVAAVDAQGKPLADVAVWATAKDPAKTPRGKPFSVEVGQKNRAFEHLVSVVESGQKASFPNHDNVRHHVYSFSEPKVFDIKLYAGGESPGTVFDKEGLVVLGCNIHDKMIAYVRVVPSSAFAVTDASGAAKMDLPNGEWVLHAWHPSLGEQNPGIELASKGGSGTAKLVVKK